MLFLRVVRCNPFSGECKYRKLLYICNKLLMVKNDQSGLSFTNYVIVFSGAQWIWINRFIQHNEAANILQTTFSNHFLEWKLFYFDSNFTEMYSQWSN